jgi:hypothetical protein
VVKLAYKKKMSWVLNLLKMSLYQEKVRDKLNVKIWLNKCSFFSEFVDLIQWMVYLEDQRTDQISVLARQRPEAQIRKQ